jgi:hypothetical protein
MWRIESRPAIEPGRDIGFVGGDASLTLQAAEVLRFFFSESERRLGAEKIHVDRAERS